MPEPGPSRRRAGACRPTAARCCSRATSPSAGSEDQGSPVIVTDRLTYDTTADYIQTPEFVSIRFGNHVLGGRGLRANLNTGTLRLESNVNGRFTP